MVLWGWAVQIRRRTLEVQVRRRTRVVIVECAVVADQFGLGEGGRLFVAILRSG